MISKDILFNTRFLGITEQTPGLLKVGFLQNQGKYKSSSSGYVIGYISKDIYLKQKEAGVGSVNVLFKYVPDSSTGFKMKAVNITKLYIYDEEPNVILRRVRNVGIHQFGYLREALRSNDVVGLLFESPKSINSLLKTLATLVEDYKYNIIESHYKEKFYKIPHIKYVVLAEFYPLNNCMLLYRGKVDGFGLSLSIIDPVESNKTGRLIIKNYIHITFSNHREDLCVIDGIAFRSATPKEITHDNLEWFEQRAIDSYSREKSVKEKQVKGRGAGKKIPRGKTYELESSLSKSDHKGSWIDIGTEGTLMTRTGMITAINAPGKTPVWSRTKGKYER